MTRIYPRFPNDLRSLRLSVRTPDFQSGKRGSTPLGTATSGPHIAGSGLPARCSGARADQAADFVVGQGVDDVVVSADHGLVGDEGVEHRFVDALDGRREEGIELEVGDEGGARNRA